MVEPFFFVSKNNVYFLFFSDLWAHHFSILLSQVLSNTRNFLGYQPQVLWNSGLVDLFIFLLFFFTYPIASYLLVFSLVHPLLCYSIIIHALTSSFFFCICSMSFSPKKSFLIFDLTSYSPVCLFFSNFYSRTTSFVLSFFLYWPHFTYVYAVLLIKLCLFEFLIATWRFSAMRNNICFQTESVIVFPHDNYCGYLISIPRYLKLCTFSNQ